LSVWESSANLGDMISETGGAGQALVMRVNYAWQKFRELSPILTVNGVSLKLKDMLYKSCVQSVMMYGSETWSMKVDGTISIESISYERIV
jgi:hypothetical protein